MFFILRLVCWRVSAQLPATTLWRSWVWEIASASCWQVVTSSPSRPSSGDPPRISLWWAVRTGVCSFGRWRQVWCLQCSHTQWPSRFYTRKSVRPHPNCRLWLWLDHCFFLYFSIAAEANSHSRRQKRSILTRPWIQNETHVKKYVMPYIQPHCTFQVISVPPKATVNKTTCVCDYIQTHTIEAITNHMH